MNQLTLEWLEAGQVRTHTIQAQQATKQPGSFRIGRDPSQCDLVIQHPTVSKLHVEIFFAPQQPGFFLRNLREPNPPLVDQKRVIQGIAQLHQGSQIRLGELDITVQSVEVAVVLPATVVAVPQPRSPQPVHAHRSPQPQPDPAPQPVVNLSYGLQCPKCHHVSTYDRLQVGCAWCGTSLAAAPSVLLAPGS
ncbi:FHA domain-containing protein [Thermocoleostomius sinensis]|jgi:predicted component of type VI protein secretion system|uniref:FHA domain-containing protein n=1 Tax=Thermocoleostomius sinensis A174 TaxID=2016057 RepID=A0A9E8ZJ58_9CYAN|nr:FHA domain-containing protein [Thermocoleostomius sinensis]WAL62228.1 FHA domain-containing protein [Thermocoleostomius sinensis A174]